MKVEYFFITKTKPVVINESMVISEMLIMQIVYKNKAKPW